MPKLFEAPVLKRYGLVGDLTASDYKCTPGGDGGFATWEHNLSDGGPDDWTNAETGETTEIGVTPSSHTGSSCITGFGDLSKQPN